MNRKLSLTKLLLLVALLAHAQTDPPYSTLQSVIPPSPDAISISQTQFANVNLYTGKASYALPLYTINQNGISFPISLSYTGGGGIKVEEIASSMGLGWNLSATGVVTRAIRGVADDTYAGNYIGYIHLPDFPVMDTGASTIQTYTYYAQNKYDGQPDLYSVSAGGISAQFYITREKKVMFIEKSDLKITPVFSGYSIIAFNVVDLNGTVYYFSELEKSKFEPVDNTYAEYTDYNTTSWYLTKITSPYGNDVITFSYLSGESNPIKHDLRSPYEYREPNSGGFYDDNTSYSHLYYKKPELQSIQFALGEVDFEMASATRYDVDGDEYVKAMYVKNYLGDTIRHFEFYHSYFSGSGTIQQGQGSYSYYGNPALRLKLDSLQDVSRAGNALTYRFEYDTAHFLPDRMSSYALDHWGFYNGENGNSGWEPNYRLKYYWQAWPLSNPDSIYIENGTADRNPYLSFATSCILKKVKLPTGGEMAFNYELNTSSDDRLPNTIQTSSFFASLGYVANHYSISLINEPFSYVKVTADVTTGTYSYEYVIMDSAQSYTYVHDTLVYGDDEQEWKFVSPGTYCIKVRVLGAHPDTAYQYFTRVYVDNEIYVQNKQVGGVRIRSMELNDSSTGASLVRNYYYNESGDTSSSSPSTGKISKVPVYGQQYVFAMATDYVANYFSPAYIMPRGYIRKISSAYPLGVTAGNTVGYSKVTVVDSNALKTEYYFSSYDEFPEYADGFFDGSSLGDDKLTISGKKYELMPLAPDDERDFLRGKLLNQIIYKKEGGVFKKVQQTENTYGFNMGFEIDDNTHMLPDTLEYLVGMLFNQIPNTGDPDHPFFEFKKYRLYTTRLDLKRSIAKSYTYQGGMDSLVTEADYYYGNTPWYRDSLYHYLPSRITKITNQGSELTKIFYPYDWRYGIPGSTTGEDDNAEILEAANRIAIPLLQTVEDSAQAYPISSIKNTYASLVGSYLAPNIVKAKLGKATAFEDRVSFNRYDSIGNLLEQQKTSNVKSAYIWGYNQSFPIAEVTNASVDHVAYSSFECDDKGGWSYSGSPTHTASAPTGWKVYGLGNGNIVKSGLSSSGAYYVTYWSKSGAQSVNGSTSTTTSGPTIGAWTYYEHKVNNPGGGTITVSGTGVIDELRLFPENSFMSTITYDPLVGISSQIDVNNRITYYEYDEFGRLAVVRDQDRNAVKRQCYNYFGQPDGCTYYYNTTQSQSFTRNNCGTGYTGGNYNYTVSAGTYGSAISQADANRLALADIAANGQDSANVYGTCTSTCGPGNCSGADKKCVNGVCETGVKVYTSSVLIGFHLWECTYHYEWSDYSYSQDYTEESPMACAE